MKLLKKAVSLALALSVWAASLAGLELTSITAGASTNSSKVHIWDGTADTLWFTNDKDTYEIYTPEQLAGLAELVNKGKHEDFFSGVTINLMSDIVLNDTTNWQSWVDTPPKNKWEPIGSSNQSLVSVNGGGLHPFSGLFNGNGHMISGLYCKSVKYGWSRNTSIGLFDYIQGAVIGNLKIEKSVVLGQGDGSAGVLAAASENCYIDSVEIKDVIVSSGVHTGGIVGRITRLDYTVIFANILLAAAGVFINPLLYIDQINEYKGTVINNCKVSNADLRPDPGDTNWGDYRVGALTGSMSGGGVVNSLSENCTMNIGYNKRDYRKYFFGAITGGQYLVGDQDYVIQNCYTHNFQMINKDAKQQDASLVTTLSKNEYLSQSLVNKLGKGFTSVTNGTPVITSLKDVTLNEIIIPGDFDNSGKLELLDIVNFAKAYANQTALDYRTFHASDIDGNGKLNLSDIQGLAISYAKILG